MFSKFLFKRVIESSKTRNNVLFQVDLCGHATLAAAHTLFKSGKINSNLIEFVTRSGILTAKKVPEIKTSDGEAKESCFIELNFPVDPLTEFNSVEAPLVSKALGGASMINIQKTTSSSQNLLVIPLSILSCRKFLLIVFII